MDNSVRTAQENDNKQKFKVGDFEGPLDLLLFLIRKSEINIYDIPIAHLTEQYLEYLHHLENIDLGNLTDFYLMASTLIYIKSKLLLPMDAEPDEDMEDPRQELVEKLIEYQKYKKLSELITQRAEDLDVVIERKKQPDLDIKKEESEPELKHTVHDLMNTFYYLIKDLTNEAIISLYDEITVNEKISLVHEYTSHKKEFYFSELLINRTRLEIVCAFLAILESAKIRRIHLIQTDTYTDIRIITVSPENDTSGNETYGE